MISNPYIRCLRRLAYTLVSGTAQSQYQNIQLPTLVHICHLLIVQNHPPYSHSVTEYIVLGLAVPRSFERPANLAFLRMVYFSGVVQQNIH